MSTQIIRENFEEIYEKTYSKALKLAIIKCKNIDDINDIIQDTYFELLKILKKKKILEIEDVEKYILGIENNIIKRHYHKKKKDNIITYYQEQDNLEKEIEDIFYLYFALGMKISEISKELDIGSSNVKNRIYRTLKEIKKYLGEDVIKND